MKDTTTATRSLRLLLSGATAALLMAAVKAAATAAMIRICIESLLDKVSFR